MSTKKAAIHHIIIGEFHYRSSGNIDFSEGEDGYFVMAESALLEKVDAAIEEGILENGMQMLLKKFRG